MASDNKPAQKDGVRRRGRRARVSITYDIEVGDAIEQRELPFVVGVFADLSGTTTEPLPRVGDRKFIQVDRDNFNQVLRAARPRARFAVPNRLDPNGANVDVDITFESIDEFRPEVVADQVVPLRRLLQTRQTLEEILLKLGSNRHLEQALTKLLERRDLLLQLADAKRALTEVK
jgi:type VI secretion system protein ImpB